MRSASASNSPGVTATSCTQATTPNVPTPPKRQPILGQIYGLTPFRDDRPASRGVASVGRDVDILTLIRVALVNVLEDR
jgi:hypothetical protein